MVTGPDALPAEVAALKRLQADAVVELDALPGQLPDRTLKD